MYSCHLSAFASLPNFSLSFIMPLIYVVLFHDPTKVERAIFLADPFSESETPSLADSGFCASG